MSREDYTKTGPYHQVCKVCGQKIGAGGLQRAGPEKGKRHQEALARTPARATGERG